MDKSEAQILVVDDEEIVRDLVADILEEENYNVDKAFDAYNALDKLSKKQYDLVITDKNMPGMDGVSLLEEIRNKYPGTVGMIVTAFPSEESILKSFESNAYTYIKKPFHPDDLLEAVSNALDFKKVSTDVYSAIQAPCHNWVGLTASTHEEFLHRFKAIFNLLNEARLSEKDKLEINTVIEEIGRNAIEWGNRFNHDLKIKFSYAVFDDKIVFCFEDEGEGFNPDQVPDPTIDPNEHIQSRIDEGKRFGGYGLMLAKKIMDEIMFNKKGNLVIFTKYLEKELDQ